MTTWLYNIAEWPGLHLTLSWVTLFLSLRYVRHFGAYLVAPKKISGSRYEPRMVERRRREEIQPPVAQADAPEDSPDVPVRVVRVVNGGFFFATADGVDHELPIRLAWIQAPDLSEKIGVESMRVLSEMIGGAEVIATGIQGAPTVGDLLCEVSHRGLWINREMVRLGLAWPNKDGEENPFIAKARDEAEANRAGIWDGTHH